MENLSCENEIYLHDNEKSFYINSFALSLALKQRLMEQLGNGLFYSI